MSSKKQKHHHSPVSEQAVDSPSLFSNTVLYCMLAVLGGLLGYAGWQYYNDRQPPESAPIVDRSTANPTPAVPAAPAVPIDPQKLRGEWGRSDGGYILAIKNVADDGKLDAAYLNPNPINVARAELTKVNGELRVFVELRDVNYPGSTYDLRYDPVRDQLVGEYFQATQQQRFPVTFERAR